MPAKYLMYPLWASGTSESVAGRVHHTYVAGLLNPCPSVRDLVVAGLQRRCPVPVAVDEAAVLVCRAAPEREYCLFSGTWAVCVCVCVCVCARACAHEHQKGWLCFHQRGYLFSFRQETVSVIACAGVCLQACTWDG